MKAFPKYHVKTVCRKATMAESIVEARKPNGVLVFTGPRYKYNLWLRAEQRFLANGGIDKDRD